MAETQRGDPQHVLISEEPELHNVAQSKVRDASVMHRKI